MITAQDIRPYIKEAQDELLTFQKAEKTLYIGAYTEDDQLAGFVGILLSGSRTFFKNDYVLSQYRNRGVYTTLFERRLELCRKMSIRSAAAFVTDASLPTYVKYGASVHKRRGLTTYVTIRL